MKRFFVPGGSAGSSRAERPACSSAEPPTGNATGVPGASPASSSGGEHPAPKASMGKRTHNLKSTRTKRRRSRTPSPSPVTPPSPSMALSPHAEAPRPRTVLAMPWCYNFRVFLSPTHTADFSHEGKIGMSLEPHEDCLAEWAQYVIEALDHNMLLNGGWSPSRSILVQWSSGERSFVKAECGDEQFDLCVSRDERNDPGHFSINEMMSSWKATHGRFQTACWEAYLRSNTSPPGARGHHRHLRFLNFIRMDCLEMEIAMYRAGEWWTRLGHEIDIYNE